MTHAPLLLIRVSLPCSSRIKCYAQEQVRQRPRNMLVKNMAKRESNILAAHQRMRFLQCGHVRVRHSSACTHVKADGAGPQRGVLTAYNSARLNMVGGDECVMQQILQLIQLHRVLDTKQTITSRVSIIVFIHTDQ